MSEAGAQRGRRSRFSGLCPASDVALCWPLTPRRGLRVWPLLPGHPAGHAAAAASGPPRPSPRLHSGKPYCFPSKFQRKDETENKFKTHLIVRKQRSPPPPCRANITLLLSSLSAANLKLAQGSRGRCPGPPSLAGQTAASSEATPGRGEVRRRFNKFPRRCPRNCRGRD